MTEHHLLLLLCFTVALCVNYIAHRVKGIERKGYGRAVVGLVSGFASFGISLLVLTQYSIHWAFIGVSASCIYAYFMADAKGFDFIGREGQ